MHTWEHIRKAKVVMKTHQKETEGFPGSDMNEQKL